MKRKEAPDRRNNFEENREDSIRSNNRMRDCVGISTYDFLPNCGYVLLFENRRIDSLTSNRVSSGGVGRNNSLANTIYSGPNHGRSMRNGKTECAQKTFL